MPNHNMAAGISTLLRPKLLKSTHDLTSFDCGSASLNEWLIRRAMANQVAGATKTFVACAENRVVAYYSLASSAIMVSTVSGRFRRNMPDPIPVILLARLAVDHRWQGKGLARALMRDAGVHVLQASRHIGVRGIVVHAISEEARNFYLALGFEASPLERMTLVIRLSDLAAAFGLD